MGAQVCVPLLRQSALEEAGEVTPNQRRISILRQPICQLASCRLPKGLLANKFRFTCTSHVKKCALIGRYKEAAQSDAP